MRSKVVKIDYWSKSTRHLDMVFYSRGTKVCSVIFLSENKVKFTCSVMLVTERNVWDSEVCGTHLSARDHDLIPFMGREILAHS